jgi:hypothetical protein
MSGRSSASWLCCGRGNANAVFCSADEPVRFSSHNHAAAARSSRSNDYVLKCRSRCDGADSYRRWWHESTYQRRRMGQTLRISCWSSACGRTQVSTQPTLPNCFHQTLLRRFSSRTIILAYDAPVTRVSVLRMVTKAMAACCVKPHHQRASNIHVKRDRRRNLSYTPACVFTRCEH